MKATHGIMSPEPMQEPVDDGLNTQNLPTTVRAVNDSDSDDEDDGTAGYVPLSQIPTDNDPILDEDEENDWVSNGNDVDSSIPDAELDVQQGYSPETIEVWSSPHNRSSIDMDTEKINQVKSMMASFTLPNSAIPEWASTISEDQWKEQLIGRIKEMQNRDKQV